MMNHSKIDSNQWSEKLIELTKEEIMYGGHGIAVKNYNGQFGIISGNFNVINRETNEKVLTELRSFYYSKSSKDNPLYSNLYPFNCRSSLTAFSFN